jgi:predicted peroxiredoxin
VEDAVKDKLLVNLSTGLEDPERVMIAFLVATAALGQRKQVVIWTTKDAVRLGLPGEATGVACEGCPPLERLFQQFAEGGGEIWLCPICVGARGLDDAEKIPNSRVAGATPMLEWAGSDTTVFSY